MINNQDIFLKFYEDVKKSSDVKEIIKEYGGANIYIPSYKNTHRDSDLAKAYKDKLSQGHLRSAAVRELARDFNLSQVRVYEILASQRSEPSLF